MTDFAGWERENLIEFCRECHARMPKMLEKNIERTVCDYAKSIGVMVYKFTSPGHAFVPDRMFILPSGKVFFIEFKAPGRKATPMQDREHLRLRNYNIQVEVIDNITDGKAYIDRMMSC